MSETRLVSETGGEKGQKASQLSTIDPLALLHLGEVSGFGAQKYAAFNYLKGYDWALSVDALERHTLGFWAGDDRDHCPIDCEYANETGEGTCRNHSGLLHPAMAAWHGLALTSFVLRGLGTDGRFKGAVDLGK